MKKFFDRYLFSRLGLQILFSVLVILLFSLAGTLLRNWATGHSASDVYSQTFWGFRQITDGGSMAGTLDGLDEVASESGNGYGAPVVLVVALVSWLVGMVLYGFVAGAVANAFAGRKEKIDAGLVRYRFRDHGVVVGWDFQGVATVLAMFDTNGPWKCREVVVLSERPAADIRAELATELDEKTLSRVFLYNGSAGIPEDRTALCAHKSKVIVILGDQNESNNDGGNMRLSILVGDEIERALRKEAGKEEAPTEDRILPEPIPVFVDITGIHAVRPARHKPKSGETWPDVSVRIVNFFEESAHEILSSVSRLAETGEERVPLHFRTNPDATHAHLVVAGFDPMAQALVLRAARILGAGTDPDRITIFTTDEAAATRFRGAFPVDRLLNVRVEFVPADIADPAQAERLGAIVRDMTASVTLAVCEDVPDKALETFACLPRSLRFENIRVLVEQRCLAKWAWRESSLRWMGYEDVTFFGATDRYLSSVGDREAIFRALSPEEAAEADYIEPDIAPAFLETLVVCGYRPAPAGAEPVHAFGNDEIERLARTSQNGRANGILLDGREPGTRSARGLFVSDRIRPWDELSNANRAELVDEWRKALPVMERILASGNSPMRLVPLRPPLRIGVLPSGKNLWTTAEEKESFVVRMQTAYDELRVGGGVERGKSWPRGTVLSADPTDSESLKFAQFCLANMVRLDAVLPAPAETCAVAITDSCDREDFLRTLRRAWAVTVAPGGDVAACIRSRATVVADLAAIPSEKTTPTA